MEKIQNLISNKVWDYENGFYWFSSPPRINKLLAHYEIYKKIVSLPGDILEFGVYKGSSLIRFATFRDALENNYSRRIVGFDTFGSFPKSEIKNESDLKFIEKHEEEGGQGLDSDSLHKILKAKNFKNTELIAGNVFETLPKFLEERPNLRIALLHLDLDVKEPTAHVLDLLYDRVVPDGLIILDDYNTNDHNTVMGETDAVDNFISKKKLKLEKLSFYNVPSFIRKPI